MTRKSKRYEEEEVEEMNFDMEAKTEISFDIEALSMEDLEDIEEACRLSDNVNVSYL